MSKIVSDVQSDQNINYDSLDFVGMGDIQTSIRINCHQQNMNVPAKLRVGVGLIEGHRGIHMSRLFQLHLDHIFNQNLTAQVMKTFLQECISSQKNLAIKSEMSLKFEFPRVTRSLKTAKEGFRNYPVSIKNSFSYQVFKTEVEIQLLYSSTCPQSAKLSKEVMAQDHNLESIQKWINDESGFSAVPHSQRSVMNLKLQFLAFSDIETLIEKYIELAESSLRTPVQTVVKKADEMEFARLCAENPLFCEDAVRIVSTALKAQKELSGFKISTEHLESLHSHNAIAEKAYNYVPM